MQAQLAERVYLEKRGGPEPAGPPLRKTGFMFQIKKLCCVKDKSSVSVVYEDMSCSRHNTMSTPNHYQ